MYEISSRAYLERARIQLDKNTPENLFYAAFELRCGVEARLKEYLDNLPHINEKIKNGWRIPNLAKNIEKSYKLGNKIAKISEINNGSILNTFYHIPVSQNLQQNCAKLGNYLHSQNHLMNEKDFIGMNNFLEVVYSELFKVNQGNLLGPPLLNTKTGTVSLIIEIPSEEMKIKHTQLKNNAESIVMRVEYIDKLE